MLDETRRGSGGIPHIRVPILMYHEVSPDSHSSYQKYVVSPAAFAAQMRYLRAARFRPITLDVLMAARTVGAPLPRRAVVITLDDGFRDCVQHATRTLLRYDFPATFFLVAGLVGQTSRWVSGLWHRELRLANWPMLRALPGTRFGFGAHSMTHPRLVTLTDASCRRELSDARRVLEDRFGCEIVHTAYPFGAFDRRVRDLVAEAGYRTACTVEAGVSTGQDDALTLRRVPITGHDTLVDFVCRLHTGRSTAELRHELRRRLVRHVKRFASRQVRES